MSAFLNLQKLNGEIWLAARIAERTGGKFRCPIFAGATTPDIRGGRARVEILAHELATQAVVRSRPDTFADCFERLYGEPLIPFQRQLDGAA